MARSSDRLVRSLDEAAAVSCQFFESHITHVFTRLFRVSSEVDFAVAYLRTSGYNELHDSIVEFLGRDGIRLRILCGIGGFNITQAEPLERLLELRKQYKKKLELRYSIGTRFHPKVYIFRSGDRVRIVLGSSNLTAGGFRSNIEANFVVSGIGTEVLGNVEEFFERNWASGKPLKQADVLRVRNWEKRREPALKEILDTTDDSLLGTRYIPRYCPPSPQRSLTRPIRETSSVQGIKPSAKENVITVINYSPEGYMRACRNRLANKPYCSDKDNPWCVRTSKYCTSALLFKDYIFYLMSSKAFRPNRCHFFFAKNPHLNARYYIVGYLYMVKSLHSKLEESGKTSYYYKGDPNLSVRFPDSGKGMIPFDQRLAKKLTSQTFYKSLTKWSRKPVASVIGWYHGNPLYLSNRDALVLFYEFLSRPQNPVDIEKVKEVVSRYEQL